MHVLASVTKIVGLGHTCTKSFVHDVVVTWDETEETSESAAINPSNRTDYWLVAIILLVIACLLLLMAIAAMDCYLINKATKSTIQYNILQPSE